MVHKEDLLEMFITYDLEDLYGDFSDDGDGKLELTEKGNEVATRLIKLVEQELDRAREEGRREQQKLDCELYGTAVATDKEEVAKSTRRRRGVESKIEYIWHRIKMGQTLNSIAKRNGIEDWKVLYEHNRDLLRNPNILNYIDEDIYDIGWCINNKQGIVRIPILNSQDQEEENTVCEGCGKTITSRFMQSYTKGDGMHSYCLSCDPEKQDTPEQKEEWEFDLRNLMYRDGEQLRCAGEGKPYTGEYRELVVSMIKNLLSEREREVLNSMREWVVEYHKDNWDIRDFDAEIAIGKIIDRELDKLNKKK